MTGVARVYPRLYRVKSGRKVLATAVSPIGKFFMAMSPMIRIGSFNELMGKLVPVPILALKIPIDDSGFRLL
jgi:hypothetical protein